MRKLAGNGNLVPFNQTSGYIHLKAKENHKAGRYLEAVGLFFRALEKKDDPQIYYDLALLYKDMGCHDLAAKYLRRALALNPALHDGFYELAVNSYFQNKRVQTMEAAVLYLRHEPCGISICEAQELMDWAIMPDMPSGGRRAEKLVALAGRDDRKGRRDLAAKRFMRAGKLLFRSPDKLVDLVAHMNHLSFCKKETLALAKCAVKRFPRDASACCALSTVLADNGRKLLAAALLKRVDRCEYRPEEDAFIFSVACLAGAREVAYKRLSAALEKRPYDVGVMYMLAYLAAERGEAAQAEHLLKRCLAVCPMFIWAWMALRLIAAGPKNMLPLPGKHAMSSIMFCLEQLEAFIKRAPGEITTVERQQLEAAFTLPVGDRGKSVMEMMMRDAPDQAEILFKLWLVEESINEGMRNDMARCLLKAHPDETYLSLVHGRLASSTLKTARRLKASARCAFIKRFMAEARETSDANGAAYFAAKYYDRLPPDKKAKASGEDTYAYIAALKIIYLDKKGMDQEMERYMRELLISRRRVERALFTLEKIQKGDKVNEAD